MLLGAVVYLYAEGPRNGEPGIAQEMLAALRGMGLLGEPLCTDEGAALRYREAPCSRGPGVPVTINGTWFNLLKATRPGTPQKMSQVPRAEREQAKARSAALAAHGFIGMLLTTAVTDADRVMLPRE